MSAVLGKNSESDEKRLAKIPRRLLIVSHVIHYQHNGCLYAYGPYAREIDIWADLFPEVRIAAPCRWEPPPGDALAFTRDNITIVPQLETGGTTLAAKMRQIALLPRLVRDLWKAMGEVDAIHVRCPGNLGLLGAVLAPLRSRFIVAKYAATWPPCPGEPLTYRLQKRILASRWWRGPVTVYGKWPKQPSHVVPFFTSVLDSEHIWQAKGVAATRRLENPLRLLYTGRLSKAKNVDVILKAVANLRREGRQLLCTVVGGGPEEQRLRGLANELGIADVTRFTGALPFEDVLQYYASADVLVLVSETEGWPKAVAEAMAFGLVVIGPDRGLVPQMLDEGRGVVVPPGDVDALTSVLADIVSRPEHYGGMGRVAAEWAQRYSLEGLRDALGTLLSERWYVPIAPVSSSGACSPESV
jgi:glycosyltransferase involved in cell wall biosynthesis